MKLKFRGKAYSYLRKSIKDFGSCDNPKDYAKEIVVRKNMDEKEELDTNIHEFLHACFWDLTEEAITESAKDITEALWKLGYRKNV